MTEEKGFLDRLFKLQENGTTVKIEFLAGITTFMTMAYILAVNPIILSAAGMDKGPFLRQQPWPPAWGLFVWPSLPTILSPWHPVWA